MLDKTQADTQAIAGVALFDVTTISTEKLLANYAEFEHVPAYHFPANSEVSLVLDTLALSVNDPDQCMLAVFQIGIDANSACSSLETLQQWLQALPDRFLSIALIDPALTDLPGQCLRSGVDHCLALGDDAALSFWLSTVPVVASLKQQSLSQKKSLRILESIPDLILILDREGYCDQIITGFPDKHPLSESVDVTAGTNIRDIISASLVTEALKTIQTVIDAREPQLITAPLTINGKVKWYQAYYAPIDQDFEHVLCLARYIDDPNDLEARVAESERMLEAVLNSLPIGVFWKDKDFSFAGMNEVCMDFVGVTKREEFLGLTDADLEITAASAEYYRNIDIEIMQSGKPKKGIMEFIERPNGEKLWLRKNKVPLTSASGDVIGVLGSFEDVSEEYSLREQLESSHENFLTTQSMAKIGSWEYNTLTHEYKWSDELYNILGLEPGSPLLFLDSVERFYRDDESAQNFKKFVGDCFESHASATFESWITTDDGSRKRILHEVRYVGEHTFRSSMQDITALHQQGESLRASRSFLDSLMNTLPFGVFWKDSNFIYQGCNQFLSDYLGFNSNRDIVGMTDKDFGFSDKHVEAYAIEEREIFASGNAVLHRKSLIELAMSDGKKRSMWTRYSKVPLYDSSGVVNGILCTLEDITESHNLEQEMQRNRQILETTQHISKIGGWTWDMASDELSWSDEVYRIYEVDKSVPITLEFSTEFFSQEEIEKIVPRVSECREKGVPYTLESHMRLPSGNTKWLRISGQAVRNSNEEITGLVGAFQDITEERNQLIEQRNFENRVQQAQKLESLGVLAGGIAHDFNNLLVSIMGYSSIARGLVNSEAPVYDLVGNIEDAATKAAELTKQMLAYSGKGKFVTEDLLINDLIEQMRNILRVTLPKGVVIKENYSSDLPMVNGDKAQLSQVVMNLITNAGEAIGDRGGVISITTDTIQADDDYLSSGKWSEKLQAGEFVFFEVSDTGFGMDEATVARIFDPFFTTKFTGRGLGLAAVLGIVRGHHGAISVSSKSGNGTTFRILLPISTSSNQLLERSSDTIAALHGHALVVDDEEGILAVAKLMLEMNGMEVDVASDGRAGVESFAANPDKYDVVILDMTMPHLSGPEAFKEIREIRADSCVMLTSGYSEEEATAAFAGKHLSGFIQKPFSVKEFVEAVRSSMAAGSPEH